ncbi:DUF1566 domain-containing protein [Alkalimonas amylolytica]|uniref:Lcl C-terminal domain-containing protein n=1 Tax=Alkalimonas amylolytica TaxID=152573 RepID=A0A1H4EZK6_ALKAM|nr:DUF1566 domain-containing protein [Alkalimonas amylolytica]SEA90197.1 Protein of unknown function [Alkalimonas amylolytica]
MKNIRWILLISVLLLTACGGKGSEAESLASVNAGPDQTLHAGAVLTLAARGDPSGGEFSWHQLSGPALIGFPHAGAEVSLVLPEQITQALFIFEVRYRLMDGRLLTDRLQVQVLPRVSQPVALIQSSLTTGQLATTGEPVLLDGSSSFDPEGQSLSFSWQQLAGDIYWLDGMNLSQQQLQLKAPLLATDSRFLFELTVQNAAGLSDQADIEVWVQGNTAGIYADPGPDQTVMEFKRHWLDGSHSASLRGGVHCSWSQVAGNSASLTDVMACKTDFIVPDSRLQPELRFQLQVQDGSGASASAELRLTVHPSALHYQVDTGQSRCYDQLAVIPCDDQAYPRQDADFGRDSVAPFLNKIGVGRAGFDFSKLDAFGDELPRDATDFVCLRDNVTGLIWELKEPVAASLSTASLRSASNYYSWTSTADGNGGNAGQAAPAQSGCPSNSDCGTATYVAAVNASLYCGGANWRLPTVTELNSLVDFGQTEVLDPALFRHEPAATVLSHRYYWTRQSSAEGGGAHAAWVISMDDGNDNSLPKRADSRAYVRLVRSP